ncbi:MAG: nucleoside hydrolase [Clostridia bacterium]|nr:nucleoside hydrolase [Clostridia bacterium]
MKKMPVILDCDPGIDDALAMLIMYQNKEIFDLKLISASAGNTPIDITTKNIQFFAEKFFNGVKVAKGIGKPLKVVHPETAEDVHGVGGLGNYQIPEQNYPYEEDSVEVMYKTICDSKEKMNLIVIGPQTNIAKLIQTHPDVVSKIERIYAMIGSINGIGNVRPYAEFNAFFDPDAFKIVSMSGIPMTINPMELGHNSRLKKSIFASANAKNDIQIMIQSIIDGLYEWRDPSLVSIFDLHTVYSIVKPELYDFVPCDVNVTLDGKKDGECFLKENPDAKNYYISLKNPAEANGEILEDLFSME